MYGPNILARTISRPTPRGAKKISWQYNSRSDHHSKVACWAIILDLLNSCPLLSRHAEKGKVAFGINHEMSDYRNDRKKNLDLVICTPVKDRQNNFDTSFRDLSARYSISLSTDEANLLGRLPLLRQSRVGSVLMALEAKACMTEHQKALPRLYDELNSSHLTVHSATDQAIAAGFVMINVADQFVSSDKNKEGYHDAKELTRHKQPKAAELVIRKLRKISRRRNTSEEGYDALAIVVVDCKNDGSPVTVVTSRPAPEPNDIYHYDNMISRIANIYTTRFKHL